MYSIRFCLRTGLPLRRFFSPFLVSTLEREQRIPVSWANLLSAGTTREQTWADYTGILEDYENDFRGDIKPARIDLLHAAA